ncbi:MAG: hypothetical protein CM1200mP39_22430 [Dehalococcoidia bacterium]|nr:MAG: hypothetical protein CM1200mP39_22430 [Dehalococcoidia bacterium]
MLLAFASQLTTEGSFVDIPNLDSAKIDKINVAIPALVLAFGGFVALRAFPALVEVVARVISPFPRVSVLFPPQLHWSPGKWLEIQGITRGFIANDPNCRSRGICSSFAATLGTSAADRAKYQSGADLRVNGVSYTNRFEAGRVFSNVASIGGVELSSLHSVLLELIFPQRLEVPLRI